MLLFKKDNTDFVSAKDFSDELSAIVKATETKTALRIESERLSRLSALQFAKYCAELAKSNVTDLTLNVKAFGQLSRDRWQMLCQAINCLHLKKLTLIADGSNPFSEVELTALCRVFKQLPITELELFRDSRLSFEEERLKPVTIGNGIAWMHLFQAMAHSSNLKVLDFYKSNLALLPRDVWQAFCDAIIHIDELILRLNDFESLFSSQWQAFAKALLRSKITKLNIGSNLLHQLGAPDLNALCDSIAHSRITKLNLTITCFIILPLAHWQAFCKALAQSYVIELSLLGPSDILSEVFWQALCEAFDRPDLIQEGKDLIKHFELVKNEMHKPREINAIIVNKINQLLAINATKKPLVDQAKDKMNEPEEKTSSTSRYKLFSDNSVANPQDEPAPDAKGNQEPLESQKNYSIEKIERFPHQDQNAVEMPHNTNYFKCSIC